MADRPRFFDDLAGVAGNAMSALTGMREEIESLVRARMDEAIRRFDLVKREEVDAFAEIAAKARAGQEAAEATVAALMHRVVALEARVAVIEAGRTEATVHPLTDGPVQNGPVTDLGGPGMIV